MNKKQTNRTKDQLMDEIIRLDDRIADFEAEIIFLTETVDMRSRKIKKHEIRYASLMKKYNDLLGDTKTALKITAAVFTTKEEKTPDDRPDGIPTLDYGGGPIYPGARLFQGKYF